MSSRRAEGVGELRDSLLSCLAVLTTFIRIKMAEKRPYAIPIMEEKVRDDRNSMKMFVSATSTAGAFS